MKRRTALALALALLVALLTNACTVEVTSTPEGTSPPSPGGTETATRVPPSPVASPDPQASPTIIIGPLPAETPKPTADGSLAEPKPTNGATPAPPDGEEHSLASSFSDLKTLDSYALETVVRLEDEDGGQDAISASYAYSAEPPAERLVLSGTTAEGEPTRMEIIQVAEGTYVDQDAAGAWQPIDGELDEILAALNLAWLVEPQDLLGDRELTYVGSERVLGQLADRYAADAALLTAVPTLAELRNPTGRVDVWVSTRHRTIIQVIADAMGHDSQGNPLSLYVETAVTGIGEDHGIGVPGVTSGPTPTPAPPAGEGSTVDLEALTSIADLPSYRLYVYFVEDADNYFGAEMLREVQQSPAQERLVFSARIGEEAGWSEMVQIGDETWVDESGDGSWELVSAPIRDLASVGDVLPNELLAPLARIEGQLVGQEEVLGERAEHYRWSQEQLAGELSGQGTIEAAQADAWISVEHQVPVQVLMYVQAEDTRLFVQYAITDIGEEIGIVPPEESRCPEADALQVGGLVSGETAAAEAECFRFIALEGERLTLEVAVDDEAFDPKLTVFDSNGRHAHYNDDGPDGLAPLLSFAPERSGLYYVEVAGFGREDAGAYTLGLRFFDETTDTFATAEPIQPGETVSGAITADSLALVESYEQTVYGNLYTFGGTAGQTVIASVRAEALGSELDPQVFLLDPDGQLLASDDDGLGGLDAQLTHELSRDGPHYVLVNRGSGEPYGDPETYFYELTLTIE